ncbi:MAG TPA: PIN domain-containing protein [Tepidisphaeraceae bacterium]|nr:PIN domain-containing protein [Tepidisphaeraceae bacterium]
MANSYVVDTHALIWYLAGDARLGGGAAAAMNEMDAQFYLPAIVLAEAVWIVEHNRTNIDSPKDLIAAIDADARMIHVPLDREIVEMTVQLRSVGEMHDRQIVATAQKLIQRGEAVFLLSKDVDITASATVPTRW